ncbi:MAG TPA: hypothetical protein VGO92_09275, partial [Acidimicrobiales bacterium]|nr:hypothetical protein [Acidimicrobiales bacterium]
MLSRSATALACLAAAVALGVVVHSHTPSFDAAAVRGLHRALVHARLGVDLLKAVTALGALPWLLVVAAFAVWRLDRRSALVVVAALAAAVVVGNVGKLVVDRPRPVLVDPFAHGLSSSYPSGHT